jgi:hypothetical protein
VNWTTGGAPPLLRERVMAVARGRGVIFFNEGAARPVRVDVETWHWRLGGAGRAHARLRRAG